MKLSDATITTLKNFSTINPGLIIRRGNTLRTISKLQSLVAKVEVPESFDDMICIYDLNRFLAVLGSLKDPDIAMNDNRSLRIKSESSVANYGLSDESLITAPPEKDLAMADAEVNFSLTQSTLAQILRLAGVMSLPNVCVRGNRSKISIAAVDVKNTDSDVFSIDVGETSSEFQMIFITENFKFLPENYEVAISSKGIAHFKNSTGKIQYWVATEAGSSFTE